MTTAIITVTTGLTAAVRQRPRTERYTKQTADTQNTARTAHMKGMEIETCVPPTRIENTHATRIPASSRASYRSSDAVNAHFGFQLLHKLPLSAGLACLESNGVSDAGGVHTLGAHLIKQF